MADGPDGASPAIRQGGVALIGAAAGLALLSLLLVPAGAEKTGRENAMRAETKASDRSPPPVPPPATVEAELAAVEADWSAQRWKDILGTCYARAFRKLFRYDEARVRVTYEDRGETFRGRIEAENLKPNFAYQIKLRGDWARDPETARRLGYAGRWRLPGWETNFTDADVERHADLSEVEAYLFFDYFVTDGEGSAAATFALESSLHVLWNEAVNPEEPVPNHAREYTVAERSMTVYGLAAAAPPARVRIWAEPEGPKRNRPPMGETRLPPGRYDCILALTEESFHDGHVRRGGYWATVLAAPVRFEIVHP